MYLTQILVTIHECVFSINNNIQRYFRPVLLVCHLFVTYHISINNFRGNYFFECVMCRKFQIVVATILCNAYLNTFLTRVWKLFKRRNYLQGYLLLDFISINSIILFWAIFHNFQRTILGKVVK